ncbi:hypothetical protein Pssp01_59500 [Pseudomonas sp. NBRC 100443]|nr:hypothetical protein Pssp01_59500 [Pseudomonas sp. NBRC 100443]
MGAGFESALSLTLGCAPRPEGRGDRSVHLGSLESAGKHRGCKLKLSSSRHGQAPSPFRERAGERVTDFYPAPLLNLAPLFASKLAPTKSIPLPRQKTRGFRSFG